jgi:hypothetical protein
MSAFVCYAKTIEGGALRAPLELDWTEPAGADPSSLAEVYAELPARARDGLVELLDTVAVAPRRARNDLAEVLGHALERRHAGWLSGISPKAVLRDPRLCFQDALAEVLSDVMRQPFASRPQMFAVLVSMIDTLREAAADRVFERHRR